MASLGHSSSFNWLFRIQSASIAQGGRRRVRRRGRSTKGSSMSEAKAGVATSSGLRAGSLGPVHLVFLVLAAAAPMAGVVGTIPLIVGFGVGPGTPGVF